LPTKYAARESVGWFLSTLTGENPPGWASDASMFVKSPAAVRVRGVGRGCGRGSV
jgi:hypothetical protein